MIPVTLPNGQVIEVDTDDETAAAQAGIKYYRSIAKQPQPAPVKLPTPAQAAVESGRRGGLAALQGLTFGFADEALAALNAAGGSLGQFAAGGEFNPVEQYRNRRDAYRQDVKQFEQERPILSTATQVAASAPTMLLGAPAKVGVGLLPTVAAGAKSGLAFGALGALGASDADTAGEMAIDTLGGAAISAGVGAAVPVLGAAMRAAKARPTLGRNVGSFIPGSKTPKTVEGARNFAREKVAQAFIRDTPGAQTAENAARRVESMARQIPGARAVDLGAAGPGGRSEGAVIGLADTLALLPGKTRNKIALTVGERQAGLGNKIAQRGANLLGAQGIDYGEEMAARAARKSEIAGPYYEQLRGVKFTVDDELASVLGRVDEYVAGASKIAKLEGAPAVPVGLNVGDEISLDSLNTIKRTLFGAAEKAKRDGDGTLVAALNKARIALKDKIDDLSPKDAEGRSIARVADELWSGAESDRAALEMGRRAMKDDAVDLADELAGMSQSEIEAWRIGAARAIKDMAGTQAGQTKLLKQWREPGTSEKLRLVFGGNYKEFQRFLGQEARKKSLESTLGGAQTARRAAGVADLEQSAIGGAVDTAMAAKSGLPLASLMNRFGFSSTPEPVRDEIGDILMGSPDEIPSIIRMMQGVQEQRARTAAGAGAFTGATIGTTGGFFQ